MDMNMGMDAESQAKMAMESGRGVALGSQFMAVTFDALLCGVILCQCLRWLPNYRNDRLLIRIVVTFGALAAIATTCFTWGIYMQAFVQQFGMYAAFADFKYFGIYPLLDILTVVPVQLVFADRSVKINNRSLAIIIINYGAMTAGSAISVTALSQNHTVFTKTDALKTMMVLWPAICTTTHLILTGTILYGLYKTREGANQTRQMLDRIIFMSLESQAPGTIFAFTAMVVIASDVNSPFIPWIVVIHPKVFLIGCLAMINVRHTWQREGKLPTTLESRGRTDYRDRSQRSGSSASEVVGTPTLDNSARPGVIMLSTFDEENGPGMRLSQLTGAIDLEDKKSMAEADAESEIEGVKESGSVSHKVDHMV